MAFDAPRITNENVLHEDQFGVQNSLVFGIQKVHNHLQQSHPLAYAEENREILEQKRMFQFASVLQGQHAPLKFKFENEFAGKIGRLPCLRSSNLMQSVLKGTDDTIDVKDVFNNQREFREFNIDPHNELYKIKL